jgi:serine/threonine-protein kinase
MSSDSSSTSKGGDAERVIRNLRQLREPPVLGPYRCVRFIGRGGMGTVWEAASPRGGRVAVKLLDRNYLATEKDIVRFDREVRLAKSLRHPNVVSVLDYDACPLGAYIVMELVDGARLDVAVERLGLRERLELLLQVSRGVEAAHAKGILNRDIKPGNVLLDRHGHARVADFGLAVKQDGSRVTGSSTVLGTAEYMAPEQHRGDHGRVGTWTDVWALGVMMYEMLAGRNPFDGDAHRVEHRPPPKIHRSWPNGMARPLTQIVGKALSKEPVFRYRHGGEFAVALQEALESEWKVPPGLRRTGWRR